MTIEELCGEIRRRAGVRRAQIPVRIVAHPRSLPPTLQHMKRTPRTLRREVVVSVHWLQRKAPHLWAAFCAHRMLDIPGRLTITPLKEAR